MKMKSNVCSQFSTLLKYTAVRGDAGWLRAARRLPWWRRRASSPTREPRGFSSGPDAAAPAPRPRSHRILPQDTRTPRRSATRCDRPSASAPSSAALMQLLQLPVDWRWTRTSPCSQEVLWTWTPSWCTWAQRCRPPSFWLCYPQISHVWSRDWCWWKARRTGLPSRIGIHLLEKRRVLKTLRYRYTVL